MSDEYQEATKKLMEFVTQAANFSKEQMPDVVSQMLAYDAKMAWMMLILCSLVLVICIFWFFLATIGEYEGNQAVSAVLGVIMGVCVVGNYGTLTKIETAPKLYVMDELSGRLRHGACGK